VLNSLPSVDLSVKGGPTLTRLPRLRKALALASGLIALLPAAAAAADDQIAAPKADAYLQPIFLNNGNALVAGDALSFSADTAGYTTQANLYDPQFDANANPVKGPAGPAEPTTCGSTGYGKTIWTAFHSSKYGVADISATSTSFDEVIRVIPFESPSSNPAPDLPGSCYDDSAGFTQTASGIVTPGQWFAVQVGGTTGKKAAAGGPVQVKIALDPPPVVDGNAVLRWKRGRVSSLKVSGATQGARVTLTCGKHACKSVEKTARKSKLTLLSSRKVKKGTTVVVRITATGYIGKQFVWRAGGARKVSCTNPGSKKARKPGTCTG
jgi:hypothetical protein